MELYFHNIETYYDKTWLTIYASTTEGDPITLRINGFRPWFYCKNLTKDIFDKIVSDSSKVFFEEVHMKNLIGFTDKTKLKYVKLSFISMSEFYRIKTLIESKYKFTIYESKVDPILKFIHSTGLKPSSFFKVSNFKRMNNMYLTNVSELSQIKDDRVPPPMSICSYCVKDETISVTYSKLGSEDYRSENIPINIFKDKLLENNVMILIGYKSNRFTDLPKNTIYIDILSIIKENKTLRCYKLNSVYSDLIGFNDMEYSQKLLHLTNKLNNLYDFIQMSSMCSVPMRYIIERGQDIRCYSLILNSIYGEYVCNYVKDNSYIGGFKGGKVLDAKVGFYGDEPICVLDYKSMYPSIIRSKQICYTTYVDKEEYLGIDGVIYKTYDGCTFAHRPGEKSVLCKIQDYLISERIRTKAMMDIETDTFKYNLLDSKQKAQKLTSNAMYGVLGSMTGSMPLKQLASSIAYIGRDIITRTVECVEKDTESTIVAGDTDSIFVKFKIPSEESNPLRYSFREGNLLAKRITKMFEKPIEFELEKVFTKFLLVSKKNYSGLVTSPDGSSSLSVKGLVSMRKDVPPVVSRCATVIMDMLFKEKSKEDIGDYLSNLLDSIVSDKLPIDDFIITKELRKISQCSPQSTIARILKEREDNQFFFRKIVKPVLKDDNFDYDNLCKVSDRLMEIKSKKNITCIGKLISAIKDRSLYRDALILEGEDLVKKNEVECSLLVNDLKTKVDILTYYRENVFLNSLEWECPNIGDKVQYVIISGNGNISDRVECPEYVKKARYLKIDRIYYIENQLMTPIVNIVDLFMGKGYTSRIFIEHINQVRHKKMRMN